MRVATAALLLILLAYPVATHAQDNQAAPPTNLSEHEQANLEQGKRDFGEYLSWAVVLAGGVVFIFALLHLKRLGK